MTDSTQKIFITGGSRGIGRALVEHFAERGAQVFFTYHANAALADDVSASVVQRCNVPCVAFRCDVRDPHAVEQAFNTAWELFDGIDVLINNAGVTRDQMLLSMTDEEWWDVFNTSMMGTFYASRCAIKRFLRRRAGVIVNIASVAGVVGVPGQTNYCATKSAVIGFSRALSKECAARNIRVNVIAPGFIETDMTAAMGEEGLRKANAQIPAKRFGRSEEVAQLAYFLASNEAQYINGQTFIIDGGLTA